MDVGRTSKNPPSETKDFCDLQHDQQATCNSLSVPVIRGVTQMDSMNAYVFDEG